MASLARKPSSLWLLMNPCACFTGHCSISNCKDKIIFFINRADHRCLEYETVGKRAS